MSARSRIFSDLLAEEAENGSNSLFPPRDPTPATKRRKTGLNYKFDRMVESMNSTYHPPKQLNGSRKRARSVGSSSVSSYGAPQTPLHSYDVLQAGSLGPDFTLIKMRNKEDEDDSSQVCHNPFSDTEKHAPLPLWLSETFSTLSKKHPLRLLLPRSPHQDAGTGIQDAIGHSPPQEDHANIFAFSPPRTSSSLPDSPSGNLKSPIDMHPNNISHMNDDMNLQLDNASFLFRDEFSSPDAVPFSTPGPASSISGPAPPESHLTKLPTFSPEHSPSDSYSRAPSHFPPRITKSASPKNTPSFGPEWILSTTTDNYGAFTNSEPGSNYPDIAPAPLNSNPLDHSFKSHSAVPGCQPFGTSRLDHYACGSSVAFSTPGPGFYASCPVRKESPEHESPGSSEPTYGLDYTEIESQWSPFNRKFPHNTGYKPSLTLGTPRNVLYQDETATLHLPNDEVFNEQRFHAPISASSWAARSTDHLAMASSSNNAYDKFECEPEPANLGTTGSSPMLAGVHPQYQAASFPVPTSSPHVFRYTCPSSTLPHTPNAEAKSMSAEILYSSQTSQVATPDVYISPLRGSESPTKTPDFNKLKVGYHFFPLVLRLVESKNFSLQLGLLDVLDRIAPERPKKTNDGQVGEEEKVDDILSSQDTIESWGREGAS